MPVSDQCTIIVRREPVTSWMGTSEGRGHQSKGHVVRRRWWLPVHNLSKVTCPLINYKGFNEARAIKLDIKTYQIRFMFYPLLLPCSLSDKSFLNIKNYHQKYSVTVVDVYSDKSVHTVHMYYQSTLIPTFHLLRYWFWTCTICVNMYLSAVYAYMYCLTYLFMYSILEFAQITLNNE